MEEGQLTSKDKPLKYGASITHLLDDPAPLMVAANPSNMPDVLAMYQGTTQCIQMADCPKNVCFVKVRCQVVPLAFAAASDWEKEEGLRWGEENIEKLRRALGINCLADQD